jgi:hypothetical protein
MTINTSHSISALLVFGALALGGCDGGSSGGLAGTGGSLGTGGVTNAIPPQGGGSNGGGASSSNASGASSSNTGGGSSQPAGGLTIDPKGRVETDSNSFNIQGSWYWFADFSDGHAGLTKLADAVVDTPPFVEGKGMCLVGTTPGGANDNYVTWGAGIGLNLNQGSQEQGDTTPHPLNPYPKCFSVTLSADSTAPGGMLGKLLESNPMPGTTADPNQPQEAPSVTLKAGQSTDVCVDNVAQPSWCTASSHKPGDCADPKNLQNGIAAVQIQALAGSSGGNINVCVVSIVPKN